MKFLHAFRPAIVFGVLAFVALAITVAGMLWPTPTRSPVEAQGVLVVPEDFTGLTFEMDESNDGQWDTVTIGQGDYWFQRSAQVRIRTRVWANGEIVQTALGDIDARLPDTIGGGGDKNPNFRRR